VASDGQVHDASAKQVSVIMGETVGAPVFGPNRYALLMGNTILGSGFSSHLYRDLWIRTGYVFTVSSGFDWLRTQANDSVFFGADPPNVGKAGALVDRELTGMQKETVSEEELVRAKAEILRQLTMERACVNAIVGTFL
jgi:zinc protease